MPESGIIFFDATGGRQHRTFTWRRGIRFSHVLDADCYPLDSERLTWDVWFMQAFQDWELDDICGLLNCLYRFDIHGGHRDSFVWVLASREMFEVRSFFRCLSETKGLRFRGKQCGDLRCRLKWRFLLDSGVGQDLDTGLFEETKTNHS